MYTKVSTNALNDILSKMHSKFHYAFIVLFSLYVLSLGRRRKAYELLKAENCLEYPNLISKLNKTKIRNRRNGNNSVEMTWVVEGETSEDLEGLTSVRRCNSLGTAESCEYIVKNLKFKKICEKMTMKNQFWSSFVDSVKPPLECPLKPATYIVEIFLNDVFKYFFAVPTGVWKAQMSYLLHNRVLACVNIDFKVYEREF